MIYNEKRGDLFDLEENFALAHCISLDADNSKSWNKGIVREFRKRFPLIKEESAKLIKKNNLNYPCIIIYTTPVSYICKERVIFNLVTKKYYYGKPTYETISKCIKDMAYWCKIMNIKYLGLPKIGCGLDRLQWGKVREIIKEEFKDLDIQIEIRYL